MRNATRTFVLALAAALAGAAPVLAGDIPADVKEAIAYFEKYAVKAKDPSRYAELVHDLGATQDPAAAERIGKIFTAEKNPEHHLIAADTLGDFTKSAEGKAAAGKALVKALEKFDEEDLRISIVDSLGKLTFADGTMPICEVLRKAGSPWLMLRCVRALGTIKDMHALPTLLEILERYPVGFKWPAGDEVTVDTGSSGDADQQAAEAQYNEQHKNDRGKKGKPPVMFKAYIQELKKTIQAITNDTTIDGAQALRKWMVDRTDMLKKLGIEIPKYKGAAPAGEDPKKK